MTHQLSIIGPGESVPYSDIEKKLIVQVYSAIKDIVIVGI